MPQWYYSQYGQQLGPVETAELAHKLATGVIKPNDLVWNEGMAHWAHAGTLPELNPAAQTALKAPAQSPLPSPSLEARVEPAHVPNYYSPQTQPEYAPRPQSGLGVASFIIAIIMVMTELASFGGAMALTINGRITSRPASGGSNSAVVVSNSAGMVASGLGMFLGVFLAFVGAILGFSSLFQPRRRVFAILGLAINGGFLALLIVTLLLRIIIK